MAKPIDAMSVEQLCEALHKLDFPPNSIGRSPTVLKGKLKNALRQRGFSSVEEALQAEGSPQQIPSVSISSDSVVTPEPETPSADERPLDIVDRISEDLYEIGSSRVVAADAEVHVFIGCQINGASHYAVTRKEPGSDPVLYFIAPAGRKANVSVAAFHCCLVLRVIHVVACCHTWVEC